MTAAGSEILPATGADTAYSLAPRVDRAVLDLRRVNRDGLQQRTEAFSARLLRFLRSLERDPVIDTIVRQLARAGSSVAANYHATRRSRSRAEFIARLAIVVEEADESVHWLEQIRIIEAASGHELPWLEDEARQLRAIFARSLGTARRNCAALKRASESER